MAMAGLARSLVDQGGRDAPGFGNPPGSGTRAATGMNHRTRILLPALLLLLASGHPISGQTATWLGALPADPARTSYWTNPAYWSTGALPSSIARIESGISGSATTPLRDKIRLFGTGMTLSSLDFTGINPGQVTFPELLVGGTAPDESAFIILDGTGIAATTSVTSSFGAPAITLVNGALLFLGSSSFRTDTYFPTVTATTGRNLIWFRGTGSASVSGSSYFVTYTIGSGSQVSFSDQSSLGNARLKLTGGTAAFYDTTTAANGQFNLSGSSFVEFSGHSTTGAAGFIFEGSYVSSRPILRLSGQATGGNSVVSSSNTWVSINSPIAGTVEIVDQADGGTGMRIYAARALDISGAAATGGTTGRMRATSSTLAPGSVVADDRRTVTMADVNVVDLGLGSNSLRLSGGYLYNVRDVGGAYLSASGQNLSGGGLIKYGTGSLTLLDYYLASPYAVPMTIEEGSVYAYSRLGNTTIESKGTLYLQRPVFGDLTNRGNLVLYQASFPGSIDVTGNLRLQAGGTLTPSTYYYYWPYYTTPLQPTLQVTGTATLGGTLAISGPSSVAGLPRNYSASLPLIVAGAVTGRFDTLAITGHPRFSITPRYEATQVLLDYRVLPYADFATLPGALAVARSIDVAALRSDTFPAFRNLMSQVDSLSNAADIRTAVAALAPDKLAAVPTSAFAYSGMLRTALDQRLAALRRGPHRTFAPFVEGGMRRQRLQARTELGLAESMDRTSHATAGVAWTGRHLVAGGLVDSGKSALRIDGAGSRADQERLTPALFVQYQPGRFFVNAAASSTRIRHDLVRAISTPFGTPAARGNPAARQTDYSVDAGWEFQFGRVRAVPHVGYLASRWIMDDFFEANGGNAAMTYTGWENTSRRMRGALDLSADFLGGRLAPRLGVLWTQEQDRDRSLPARFIGATGADGYLAPGRPDDESVVEASLGLDWRVTDRGLFSATLRGGRGDHSRLLSEFTAGLQWQF